MRFACVVAGMLLEPNVGKRCWTGFIVADAWLGMAGAKGLRKGQKSEKPGGIVQRSGVVREWLRGGVREERCALP